MDAKETKIEISNRCSVLAMLPDFSWELSEIEYHNKRIAELESEIEYHNKRIAELEQKLAELSTEGGENE